MVIPLFEFQVIQTNLWVFMLDFEGLGVETIN